MVLGLMDLWLSRVVTFGSGLVAFRGSKHRGEMHCEIL